LKDVLERAVDKAMELGAEYADVRVQRTYSNTIRIVNGRVERTIPSVELTASIRVLKGTWGFSSLTSISETDLLEAVDKAFKTAKVGAERIPEPVKIKEVKPVEDKVRLGDIQDPREIPIEEKMEIIFECDKAARSIDARIVRTDYNYSDSVKEKYFCSSEGSYIEEIIPFTELRIVVVAREGKVIQQTIGRIAASAGQELMAYADPLEVSERLAQDTVKLLSAKSPPSGRYPVVVDNGITGLIALSTGLMTSAYFALMPESELGSFAGKLGQKVCSEAITLTDDPTSAGMPVIFHYDEEGIAAEPVNMIESGVLKTYIHSRETAYKFNAEPRGHSRAPNALFQPKPIVSNAIIKSSDLSFEELIEDVKEGIYLRGVVGATIGRIIQCTTMMGYRIVNGEIGEPLKGATFIVDASKDLFNVDAVANDFDVLPLRLIEGDKFYPVSGGGPHMKFKELKIGG